MKKNNFYWFKTLLLMLCLGFTGCNAGMHASSSSTGGGGGGNNSTPEVPVENEPDALFSYAWHLINIGQTVFTTQGGITGNDLNLQNSWIQNIFGEGILIRVSDDGVDDLHPDLTSNFNYNNLSRRYSGDSINQAAQSRPSHATDNHGTSVAGIIAASYRNGIGISGVAPKSQITSANFLSMASNQTDAQVIDQATGDFDILNMSWGTTQNTIYPANQGVLDQFEYQAVNGRSNRGSLLVKASGNDYYINCRNSTTVTCIGNANMDIDNSTPFTILVGALNANAQAAEYSSPGSNVWVTAPGGEGDGVTPAIISTDRTGCALGYAKSSAPLSLPSFERGQAGNTNCNYTATFAGTSASAPMVSGVVALILQANPLLTWREVKYILAKTATQVESDFTTLTEHPLFSYDGTTLPSGYVWEIPWITNSAGFKFHNWYGFGRVNVDAAVNLAQNLNYDLGTFTSTDWTHSATVGLQIPNNSATGRTSVINVTEDLKIESVQVRLSVNHTDVSQLAIELTSPSGAKSILMNMNNSLVGKLHYSGTEVFLSNAFYQESTVGDWTIKVLDGKSAVTGTFNNWSINFYGGN